MGKWLKYGAIFVACQIVGWALIWNLIQIDAEAQPDKTHGFGVEPRPQGSPPPFTVHPWLEFDTFMTYDYVDTLSHWLGPQMTFYASKGGANVTGALKLAGMNMDSTSATEVGFIFPWDFYITRVVLNCDDGSGSVDTKANFVSGGGTSHFTVTWPGSTYKDTVMGFEMAAETEFEIYVTGGVVAPDDPVVMFTGRPIVNE